MIYFCPHMCDGLIFCCGTKNEKFLTKRKNNYREKITVSTATVSTELEVEKQFSDPSLTL